MTKIKKEVKKINNKNCDKCKMHPVQFDSFRHNNRYYCGGCLQGIMQPEMKQISIANWLQVGSNGKAD